jgi:PAS domain S-box-containing protein
VRSPTSRASSFDVRTLSTLLENSGVGFWQIALDGSTIFANPAMCELFELSSPAELVGKEPEELFAPESQARFRSEREKCANGLASTYEVDLIGIKGRTRNVSVSAVPVVDEIGVVTGVFGCFTDVTERKHAERALHTSEHTLRSLFAASRDAIGVSRNGTHVMVNPAYVRMFGMTSAQELEGTSILELIAPSERETVRDHVRLRSRRENPVTSYVTRGLRRDGIEFSMEVHVSSYDAGNAPYSVVIVRDITERIALEEQLRRSQKMDALGRLAGGVAHDFNNLLTVIMSCADLALRAMPHESRPAGDLRLIRSTVERAATLTRQLLAVSRQQVFNPEVIDLNVVVGEMGAMLRRLIGTHITLALDLAPDLAHVRVDTGQLEQVVMNLCVNARDAMPGGGTLILRTRNVLIEEHGPHSRLEPTVGAHVVLSVSDSGHGMTPEVQERLFEPFFTTKPIGEGTGLGLATVYGIVRQSDGHITVETAEGQGTTMSVFLPVVTDPIDRAVSVTAERVATVERTLLLAEDEPALRELIARFLSAIGYRVLVAADGREALSVFLREGSAIDVVVTDIVMPGMSGIELARELDARAPNVVVLFMSGNALDGASVLTSRPRSAFIAKPFTLPLLAERLAALIYA